MALIAHKNVASLMQKALDRQTSIARTKFKLKPNQVQQILLSLVRDHNSGPYSELLKILRDCPLTDDNFKYLFEDLISCVVLLGRELKPLVELACNVEWISRENRLVELFMSFLLNLVTAHTYHCPVVTTCLVKQFKVEGENWDLKPPDELIAKWSNIHTVIAQIVAIMPMISDILMQTIIELFPYHKAGCYTNRAYVHNLIWISKYLPSLLDQIITAIVSRMVMMDVNIVEKSKGKSESDGIFAMDVDDTEQEVCDTLDYCMLEMLHWMEDERDLALNTMCSVFERVVLPTYGTRHIQFLLLYTVSISQQCADRVFSNLWLVAAGMHGSGPGALTTRRTAASHLSGLLARCVRVPNSRLIHYLKTMAEWCHCYITATQEAATSSDNTKAHGAFHAICHAVFYLVAFKHQYLFTTKESINFVESLNLPRLVTCSLNPLRSCPPQVCRSFSSVTRAHQLVYCQPILERNARYSLQASSQQCYDEWFPYDPYTLNRSGEIIWPLCIEYKDWLKEGDDETQYSSRTKKIDTDEDDYLIHSPHAKLASSLSNCISPGFKSM